MRRHPLSLGASYTRVRNADQALESLSTAREWLRELDDALLADPERHAVRRAAAEIRAVLAWVRRQQNSTTPSRGASSEPSDTSSSHESRDGVAPHCRAVGE